MNKKKKGGIREEQKKMFLHLLSHPLVEHNGSTDQTHRGQRKPIFNPKKQFLPD